MSLYIPHWLDKQAELTPNEIAIEQPTGETITFRKLQSSSQAYARKLASLGIQAGDHLAILSGNKPEMVMAVHAISYLGAVAVLLNTRLTASEIAFQLEDAEVVGLLCDDDTESLAIDASEGRSFTPVTFSKLERTTQRAVDLKEEINLTDVFTIMYTSGTTGFPKGVIHTYENHWWSASASSLNLGLHKSDKWLASLPLFHVGGFSIALKSVIYGMPMYLLPRFDVHVAHDAIMHQGVTIISVVTVMVDQLLAKLELDGNITYPDTFRCMLLGGGPAPKSLLEKAKDLSVPIFQTYGLTETSSQIATLSPKDALEKLGSAGKALMPAQLKIVQNGTEASPGEAGEIFVKGPMVSSGYYKREPKNDAWLATGDVGYEDEEGFLYVLDRRKDLIVSGGENIYPAEIEGVLLSMEGVIEAGVIGKSDPKWGQVPVAFVVTENHVTEGALKEYCLSRLAKYKVPTVFYFVDALPRNASNKLLRYKLQEQLYEQN
ncbi:o-succinylbenzoate--CoA ligase [Radiobacillus kanasensis]|uniref:o-succinylbenzoate--CoA ligase n=1 Tax=Radiobacillus kanasensis TaxID=2844358 RepID=UPI001E433E7E|nr:o-succinylbenzoate--CoA ligase [Radiobacillus kanasensis]UFT98179.1 o-succinylbenzoate--CoA ligase [Radiobacillus kanasensis]